MHQDTSLDVQIFKNSRGAPPDPPTEGGHPLSCPLSRAALKHGAAPRSISDSGTIQFPHATFYKNENPVLKTEKKLRGCQRGAYILG